MTSSTAGKKIARIIVGEIHRKSTSGQRDHVITSQITTRCSAVGSGDDAADRRCVTTRIRGRYRISARHPTRAARPVDAAAGNDRRSPRFAARRSSDARAQSIVAVAGRSISSSGTYRRSGGSLLHRQRRRRGRPPRAAPQTLIPFHFERSAWCSHEQAAASAAESNPMTICRRASRTTTNKIDRIKAKNRILTLRDFSDWVITSTSYIHTYVSVD